MAFIHIYVYKFTKVEWNIFICCDIMNKMEFSADKHDHWDTTRTNYILSLKNRFKNRTDSVDISAKNNVNNRALFNKKYQSESTDSQDFSLRLSESFAINDTDEHFQCNNVNKGNAKEDDTEIIIISDSSDDECQSSIQQGTKNISTCTTEPMNSKSIIFCSTNISDDITDNEKISLDLSNEKLLVNSTRKYVKCSELISDESNINLTTSNKDEIHCYNLNLITPKNQSVKLKNRNNSGNIRYNLLQDSEKISSASSSITKSIRDVNKQKNVLRNDTPNSAKQHIPTTTLTKKDTRDIARAIRSKRMVYNSPGPLQQENKIANYISETSEETNSSELINRGKQKIKHPAWIDETDSDSSEIIQDKEVETPKLLNIQANRIHDLAIAEDNAATLSARKKEQISRWLISNPIDSRSDTSMSYVPPSEQNSMNSGNSSLERLELKYETPNNRDKFNDKPYSNNNNKPTSVTPTRQIRPGNVRQTLIDSFFKKTKCDDKNISNYTPVPVSKSKKVISPSSSTEEISNFKIDDCADILDKLYGNVWRDKAKDLLPATEVKKPNPKLQDRAVQTECKKIMKSKKKVLSSTVSDSYSDDNELDSFTNNVRPIFNSTRKIQVKKKPGRDSFINDNSDSDSSNGETSFQTALTTPHVSDLRYHKKNETPVSALTLRAIEICDSDTEDDDTDTPIQRLVDNRRRLSFTDDEIDLRSSPGTSEYDPDDVIPPKTVVKPTKETTSKFLPKSKVSARSGIIKSFIASLSASVPLANAHPDAKKYRTNYKNTKDDLCKYLYKLYNDKIFENKLPDDMLIEWNVRMRGTAGYCYNKKKIKTLGKVERSSRIVLATKILDAPDRVRDTLVHEMCHAATWIINEVSDGHGPFWQSWASKAMNAFPELPSIKRCHDYKIATKYTYRCISCGYSIGRHSKSLDVERKRCGHCHGKFELYINKTTKSGTTEVKTPSNKKPSGFALFVKDNYHSVKKECHDVGHKEVMQILGQRFTAVKISNKENNVEN